MSGDVERLYALDIWPMDPYSEFSRKRFEVSIKIFDKLLEHEWFSSLLGKEKIRILEICAGTGIGGVALAKTLIDKGVDVELLLTDLRRKDLEIGARWGSEVLNSPVNYLVMDCREIHKINRWFEIVLMYGYSSPHFDPWDMLRIQASVCECLEDDGIFLMEEGDRRYSIFYLTSYAKFLPEKVNNEKAIVSIHSDYDFYRGVFKRTYLNLRKPEEIVVVDTYFWGLAELMAITWIFFKDVDIYEKTRGHGIIIGYKPRRKISVVDIASNPRVLSKD